MRVSNPDADMAEVGLHHSPRIGYTRSQPTSARCAEVGFLIQISPFLSILEGYDMVHVRFEGRSLDLPVGALRLRGHCRDGAASDAEIKALLAGHLNVSPARLDAYVIDRCPDGTLIVRPEAVYG